MRILFDMGHPADVHFFKNIIKLLQKNNHTIKICVREREDLVGKLLDLYNFEYQCLERNAKGLFNKAITMGVNDYKLFKISKEFNPDIFVSLGSPYSAHVSKWLGKRSITYQDTDTAGLIISLTKPFTDVFVTPEGFTLDLGHKQIRIKSFKELAYLHRHRFVPDPGIFNLLGINENEKFVILRFSAFDASHDIGIKGFSIEQKEELIKQLERKVKVFISSEIPLSDNLNTYRITIPPHKIHDALYFAQLFIGDSGTMTAEAGVLGTPAIVYHPKSYEINYLKELEDKYGLIFNFTNPDKAIQKAVELIGQPGLKEIWSVKVDNLLNDKIDLSAFFVWFIEEYPHSFTLMKNNPDYQNIFKTDRKRG